MKHSLKRQIAAAFIVLIVAIMGINWLINNFFLEDYYILKKEKVLVDVYNQLNKLEDVSQYGDEEYITSLVRLFNTNNISPVILKGAAENYDPVLVPNGNGGDLMSVRLWGYIMGVDDSSTELLQQTESYRIQRNKERFSDMENLEIWGQLDNGYFFLLRIPVSSIRGNVKISNEFVTYFTIVGVILSIIISIYVAKKITKPILELTDLSKRMAELDFNAKYTSGGRNEIGQLGEHFNQMSNKLEDTISELKTANNELQKDIEKKEEIDQMRKEFLANVSHELKTPIALIQGYAEGLQECINEDEESREFYCDVIIDEAGKMNQMVKKLLSLNQLEFGNDVVNMERFDIVALIQGVVNSASILAEQKEATIIFKEREPIYVWADEFKTEEVITNYVSNALNHVDFDRVVEVKVVPQENGRVHISVFNTGKPIPEEDLDKVWIKFYKVDKARTREYGGSGIGLSIVKAIMDSFHQECGVKNYDNGVEFWFELDGMGIPQRENREEHGEK